MKKILVSDFEYALVDDEDYGVLSRHSWAINYKGYACRTEGHNTSVLMHRFVMKAPKGQMVDHINGNKLDNRKFNLRYCTNGQNKHNSKVSKHNRTGYKGVYPYKNKFGAKIQVNHMAIFLGYFDDPISAANAYDKAASELCGPFAKLNFYA